MKKNFFYWNLQNFHVSATHTRSTQMPAINHKSHEKQNQPKWNSSSHNLTKLLLPEKNMITIIKLTSIKQN